MKHFSTLLILSLFITLGCKQNVTPENTEKATNEIYKGPIIYMHLHAYPEGDGFLGLTHHPTLRNQAIEGAATAEVM